MPITEKAITHLSLLQENSMEIRHTSKNGVCVYEYRNPSLHGFYISLFLRSGNMFESEGENGITHFLEHISVRNVNKLMDGKLYSELDKHGIDFNASTFYEMVQFYVSGASENFSFGAKVISEILSPIVLSAKEIEAERKRIKAEIREGDEKSSLQAFTSEVVHGKTSLARPITGTISSVSKITKSSLEKFRKRVENTDNMFFYVSGNFTDGDIQTLLDLIDSRELQKGERNQNIAPVSNNFGNREGKVYVKNGDYTAVRFTFDLDMTKLSVPVTDLIYDILFSGYNSKFFIEMSEKRGLFYDISGAVERYINAGELFFSYEIREKELEASVELALEILKGIKTELLIEDECMKTGYVDNAMMLLDDARDLNFTFAYDNHIMNLGYRDMNERILAYKNVTPKEIRAAACQIFTPKNLTLTVKGNKRKIDTEKLSRIIENF